MPGFLLTMQLTYFGSNGWQLDVAGHRLLIDPWLVGSLTFGGQEWFFKGELRNPLPLPPSVDGILLSQGLADHAHVPTLKAFDRTIPVIGSPTAAQVVQGLGYSQVTTLKPGDRHRLDGIGKGTLDIEAVAGAAVPQTENGYVITVADTQQRIYYEPHGFFESQIHRFAPVDVLITPVVNLGLPLVGPIIQGYTAGLNLVEQLRPRYILPTATGGDVVFSGILMNLLQTKGTIAEFEAALGETGSSAILKTLEAGEVWTLPWLA